MSDENISGEEMVARNLAAFESGEPLPYDDDESESQEFIEQEVGDNNYDEPEKPRGWITEDEWVAQGKDKEDYLSKEEYDRVGEMRDNRDEYTRQDLAKTNVMLQKSIQEMMTKNTEMIRKAEERARADERAKLEAKQREAIEYGNAEDAVEIQKQLNDFDRPQPQQQPQLSQPAQKFLAEHGDWYTNPNPDKNQAQAQALMQYHLNRAEQMGISDDIAIEKALQDVRQTVPQLFGEVPQQRQRPRSVSEKGKPAPRREKDDHS